MNPTYDFTGQVALVTGAAKGMGLATGRMYSLRAAPRLRWPTWTAISLQRKLA